MSYIAFHSLCIILLCTISGVLVFYGQDYYVFDKTRKNNNSLFYEC